MIKRKISSIILLCLILFIISFNYITVVKGITESFTDPQDDVFKIELATGNFEIVSSHDEIDIVNITLNGQYTNVTFAGNITGHNMECYIYFFEHYDSNNIVFEYGVHYSNFTGTGFNTIFEKYIHLGDSQYDYEFWNNTVGWTSSNTSAEVIGNSSDYIIEATIPDLALSIHNNITWYVVSLYPSESFLYLDCAPDSYCQPREPGFPLSQIILFIVIAAFVGIGAFYFYKKRKLRKDSFPL